MFYDFIYLAKGFRMRPKVWSTLIKFAGVEYLLVVLLQFPDNMITVFD